MKLFGTDGIRGVAGAYPLDNENVKRIGAAAALVFNEKSAKKPLIIIGRDTRLSGGGITNVLARALTRGGIDVWDVGVIPTPAVAYLCIKYPVAAGIVVSASHNPWQDNGIKFFSHKGMKLSDKLEAEIEKYIFKPKPARIVAPGRKLLKKNLVNEYEKFLTDSLPKGMDLKGIKIVLDCANGATCGVAERVIKKLGAKVKTYNTKANGKNINKDCGALHPDKLAKEVLKNKADIGFAFDGDGDRVMPVDASGTVRDGDFYLAVMSWYLYKKGMLNNNVLVATVMSNLGLFKAMKACGINVAQAAVGDKSVSDGLEKHGGIIGG
jgi:phosphoglucosamine mutase